jgi:hypothetical protein
MGRRIEIVVEVERMIVCGKGDQAVWVRAWKAMREQGQGSSGVCAHAWVACEYVRGSAGGWWSQCAKCLKIKHTHPGWGGVGVREREGYGDEGSK